MLYERIRTRVGTAAGDGDGEEVGDGVVQDTTNTMKAIRTKLRKRTRYLVRILAILQPLSGNFGSFTGPRTPPVLPGAEKWRNRANPFTVCPPQPFRSPANTRRGDFL